MLNKYPLWKYLMVLFVLFIGFLYALPNIYGKDPAIQVSALRNAEVTLSVLDKVRNALAEKGITPKAAGIENQQILIRLATLEEQSTGNEVIKETLGKNFVVAPNLASAAPEWLASIGGSPLNLGLDLRGGVHFLLEVDMNSAIEKSVDQAKSDFRNGLRREKVRYRSVKTSVTDARVDVVFRTAEDFENGERYLRNNFPGFTLTDDEDTLSVSAKMTEQNLKEIKEYALQQNMTIIRNRVNELGVAEPLVQRQGAEHIVVELPGIQDTAKAKEVLGATATLEFHMVDQENDMRDAQRRKIPGSTIYEHRDRNERFLLKDKVILQGSSITGASNSYDEYQRPQVNVKLDAKGGNKFAIETKANLGKPMATVFIEYKPTDKKDKNGKTIYEKDEKVINVATIQAVLGSNFRITGIDSPAEAQKISLLLRAGALIAPIQIVEERTVGPSLGQENIDKGLMSVVIGFSLVLAFMLMYYRKFGLVANLALAANLVLIVGVMSLIPGAALTLPGIAGIVLTVGMAVDANVLIFERIREELKEGRSPQQAIHHGYDSAFSTIFDANITTLIAAIILFAVGTGPIKGFAVTLSIGILTSMFTAIIGTRAVVNLAWGGRRLDKLSI